ncbi:MAG: hypothetical protein JWQ21_523 [Herminiimonas sp.]|nr:hypothetical protein [Herminiimonas sp.]
MGILSNCDLRRNANTRLRMSREVHVYQNSLAIYVFAFHIQFNVIPQFEARE